MNLAPSDFPRLAGATSLSTPGFDTIVAVSAARQTALPTVRLLKAVAARDSRIGIRAARRALFGKSGEARLWNAPRPARFFDLSDKVSVPPETMNSLFTRGFQPMLNSLPVDRSLSAHPPSDDEDME